MSKVHCVATLSAFLAISSLGVAECPSGSSMGQIDAILDYCASIDPALAPQTDAFKRELTKGVPDREIDKVLESRDFHESYDTFRVALAKIPKSQGIAACTGGAGVSSGTKKK